MTRIGIDPAVALARSRVGTAGRKKDPELFEQASRDLAAAKLSDYIRRTVESAPDLLPEQIDKLSLLLRGTP